MELSILRWWAGIYSTAKSERRCCVNSGDQISKVAWGREVLVLFCDLHNLYTIDWSNF